MNQERIVKIKIVFLISTILLIFLSACKNDASQNLQNKEDSDVNKKIFENIVVEDIREIKLFIEAPGFEKILSNEEIKELISIFDKMIIYEPIIVDESLSGQMVQIKITKSDDSIVILKSITPYFIINDIWYSAKYESCEELNQFTNKIIK